MISVHWRRAAREIEGHKTRLFPACCTANSCETISLAPCYCVADVYYYFFNRGLELSPAEKSPTSSLVQTVVGRLLRGLLLQLAHLLRQIKTATPLFTLRTFDCPETLYSHGI